MTIGIVGSARDYTVVNVCEQVALLHGGISVLNAQKAKLKATCVDGTKIESFNIEELDHHQLDEVWVPPPIRFGEYEDLSVTLAGRQYKIRCWKELYDADYPN